jgi:hypothetical protein
LTQIVINSLHVLPPKRIESAEFQRGLIAMRFGLWLVGVAWVAASMGAQQTPKPASFACPVSQPNGPGEHDYKNEYLSTMLWPDGTVVFKPGGPGSVEEDGSLAMKFAWTRYIKGQLTIDGHRLDGAAPPLRAHIPAGYGDTGFQASALIFPTPGCWEVTGHVGNGRLTFVTRVLKVGDGPKRPSQ